MDHGLQVGNLFAANFGQQDQFWTIEKVLGRCLDITRI
jgi:hypothetical protein